LSGILEALIAGSAARTRPLSHSLLNQLLVLAHQPAVSRGFFEYYWGFYRIYLDSLLYVRAIRNGFNLLREKDNAGLKALLILPVGCTTPTN
jgi:hypothetical protein